MIRKCAMVSDVQRYCLQALMSQLVFLHHLVSDGEWPGWSAVYTGLLNNKPILTFQLLICYLILTLMV